MSTTVERQPQDAPWVILGGRDGEIAHCTRCGNGLRINLPQLLEVVVGATQGFVKAHRSCPDIGYQEPPIKNPMDWLASRDAGTSSLTIWSVITGHPSPHREYGIPHDPDDFGRCYRLLQLFPEWRAKLPAVAAAYLPFAPFVEAWDELTKLYEVEVGPTHRGSAPKLYDRIQQLEAKANKVRP